MLLQTAIPIKSNCSTSTVVECIPNDARERVEAVSRLYKLPEEVWVKSGWPQRIKWRFNGLSCSQVSEQTMLAMFIGAPF